MGTRCEKGAAFLLYRQIPNTVQEEAAMAEECKYYCFKYGEYHCSLRDEDVDQDWVKRYCWNYGHDDCPWHEDSSSGCYLTTACAEACGLADDCMELTVLRAFRDGWMSQSAEGRADIQTYYRTAPAVVRAIRARSDGGEILRSLYDTLVAPCVSLIMEGRCREAHALYRQKAEELRETFLG